MAINLNIEIFAYKWFHGILSGTEQHYDVTEVYKDECLVYPKCNETSDCDNLYYAILLRRWLFEKLYLEEIQTQINEFRHSQTDFYCYVLRTCNRIDLFGSLTIFERVFATCAFVCCLCWYCCENGYPEIMRYGHICWAMYFDQFANEFYKQGGWNRLKMVAISYKLPLDFVDSVQVEERAHIALKKIRKAIRSYHHFKNIGEIDHNECISMSWIKFHTQYIHGSSDDFDELFEDLHANKLKNYIEVENTLMQLKYLCDPDGSEIVKSLGQMSAIDSLETSMANLNIYDKYVNLKSREETLLASELEQNTTLNLASKSSKKLNIVEENVLGSREPGKVAPKSLQISPKRNSLVKTRTILKDDHTKSGHFQLKSQRLETKTAGVQHSFETMTISKWKGKRDAKKNTILTTHLPSTKRIEGDKISYDSKEEQHEWEEIKEANKNPILDEEMYFTEDNCEKKNNKTRNGESNEQSEWEINGIKNQCGQITSTRKNFEKISSFEARNDQDKRKSATKTSIPNEENTEMKNGTEIRDDAWNEKSECKIMEIKSTTLITHASLSKKRVKKGNGNKNHGGTKKEQKLKDEKGEKDNASLTEQMSTGKNAKAENKIGNDIRKEQDDSDVKEFLRMLLVLGDKQGISYVKKTSSFRKKEFNN